MGIEIGGIIGLIVLILDIWAIVNVVRSPAGMGATILWILLIVLLPIIGLIIWLLFGPRANK